MTTKDMREKKRDNSQVYTNAEKGKFLKKLKKQINT